MATLRVRISGQWWSRDFSSYFRDIEVLARLAETGEASYDLDGEWKIEPGDGSLTIHDYPGSGNTEVNKRIRIARLEFASPGFTDLVGAGKLIEQIRLFLEFCITKFIERNDRELARQEKAIQLALLREALLSAKPPDAMHPEMTKFLASPRADNLVRSVLEQRINGVETLGTDE